MDVKINSVNFEADKRLKDFITGKLNKLTVYYDEIHNAEVYMKLGSNQETLNKIIEIKLKISGNDLFAKKNSVSFEESADETIEALRRQLKKHKEKIKGI